MNGMHDSGGITSFGKVLPEANEPVFHAEWEARVFGMVCAVGVLDRWTLDEDRHACENRPATEYLKLSYYNIWLEAITRLMQEKGMVSAEELKTGSPGAKFAGRILHPGDVPKAIAAPLSYVRPEQAPQRFQLGDKVRTRSINPSGHTRLPRYLRGHAGQIVAVHGPNVFPDSNAHGKGEDPQWLYTVRFTARELWGKDSRDTIHADLWEPYLEPL